MVAAGGLTGALGGLGGQSAFGTKAGDVFTRITVVVALIWFVLNCASIFANRAESERAYGNRPGRVRASGLGRRICHPSGNGRAGDGGKNPRISRIDE